MRLNFLSIHYLFFEQPKIHIQRITNKEQKIKQIQKQINNKNNINNNLTRLQQQMKYKGIPIHEIVIYKHPLVYLELCLYLIVDLFKWFKSFFIRRCLFIIAIAFIWALVYHLSALHVVKEFVQFAFYWVILGVASSIGLGTGLHTFVLYLGPHIAKVAMVATACGHLPQMLPSRWNFDHFGKCVESSESIGFFGILLAVQLQSFLWGFGTALGQLPPYFVAKKAADTNQQLHKMQLEQQKKSAKTDQQRKKLLQTAQQIDEIHYLKTKQNKTLLQRAKVILYDSLQKYGFITILLSASIPNPLFDLAGITCGHFRIPFRKFFTATFIGKAIIKVHIQMLFVIAVFRKETVNAIVVFVKRFNQTLANVISTAVENQRQNLHHPKDQSEKPLLGRLWDLFIILMVGYFLVSIVTSEVQEKAVERKDSQN